MFKKILSQGLHRNHNREKKRVKYRSYRNLALKMVDSVIPPRCLKCGDIVEAQGELCSSCWKCITFISYPLCDQCGHPIEVDPGSKIQCGACLENPPHFEHARAVFAYDEGSKPIILRYKHGDATYMTPTLSQWMRRAGSSLIGNADFIVPVPLHVFRLLKRQYNQAALLAKEISACEDVDHYPNLLKRKRSTPSQGGFNKEGREKNVKDAFVVRAKYGNLIKGKRALLIDDVFTSGATVNECAKSLINAGVRVVDVLTISRVVHT